MSTRSKTVRVDEATFDVLDEFCRATGITRRHLVDSAVRNHLARMSFPTAERPVCGAPGFPTIGKEEVPE